MNIRFLPERIERKDKVFDGLGYYYTFEITYIIPYRRRKCLLQENGGNNQIARIHYSSF
jgi:hypothetical protein